MRTISLVDNVVVRERLAVPHDGVEEILILIVENLHDDFKLFTGDGESVSRELGFYLACILIHKNHLIFAGLTAKMMIIRPLRQRVYDSCSVIDDRRVHFDAHFQKRFLFLYYINCNILGGWDTPVI